MAAAAEEMLGGSLAGLAASPPVGEWLAPR